MKEKQKTPFGYKLSGARNDGANECEFGNVAIGAVTGRFTIQVALNFFQIIHYIIVWFM